MVAKYGKWTRGQDEALLNMLGGIDVALKILTCNSVNVAFSDGKAEVTATDPIISIWGTITIGNIARNQFDSTLEKRGMNVSDRSVDMMEKSAFTVAEQEEQIELVNVSVAELGFDKATRYDVICARAKERGLELCPPEVGPQLRFQYPDQPLNDCLAVAMEAICSSVFCLERLGDALWLDGSCGYPDSCWDPDDHFVFRVCK